MLHRTQKLSESNSLFLFGARGTGKTTLLRGLFAQAQTLWIDLLTEADETKYGRHPDDLSQMLATHTYTKVVIDEVQKAPKLLDVVHREMERRPEIQFIVTGSSARKLKRGAANLLAGRAFTYHLFPLTTDELGPRFDLAHALAFGSLPKLLTYTTDEDKNEFLRAYVNNYLREEIQMEQLVRHLHPFRDFLEVAAQCNGQVLNYAKIARDIGVDDKTVRSYFSILEDTLVGSALPSFHRSIRKQQREAPKFYLFDPGVVRALDGTLRVALVPKTYAFGRAFEHWVILECLRVNAYRRLDYQLSYLLTKNHVEVDLVVQRPGTLDLLIEIKSAERATPALVKHLRSLHTDWDRDHEAELWSLDRDEQIIDGVRCLHWQQGLRKFHTPSRLELLA
ncbi:MAG: ATP-binding protein [Deltaproteobacteria bacterium]|nr:ATP-binding protein [Deltaproteobacteria bacterium]